MRARTQGDCLFRMLRQKCACLWSWCRLCALSFTFNLSENRTQSLCRPPPRMTVRRVDLDVGGLTTSNFVAGIGVEITRLGELNACKDRAASR